MEKIKENMILIFLTAFLLFFFLFFVKGFKILQLPAQLEILINLIIFFSLSFMFFRSLGNYVQKLDIPRARQIGNQVKIVGYLITVLLSLTFFKEFSSALLAIGTVSGLVLGLTLQPVLGNFFAGVLIMFTRYIEVGKNIRILSTSIPYTILSFPAHKFFSVESSDVGYKGEIIEIDWFFSVLKTEEGKILKVPNLMLLNSAILDTSDHENFVYSLRVEFPLKMKKGWNIDKLEKKIKDILKGYDLVEGPYFNEQSDKDYVYVRMRIKSKKKSWEEEKSEVLKKLLKLKGLVEKG
ncbi:MAG: mechanosensitive ion channel family protein [Candidatus Aenigmatarchaeota archaeon]